MVVMEREVSEFSFLVMKQEVLSCIEESEFRSGTEPIASIFTLYRGNDIDKKGAVDQAFRETTVKYIVSASQQNGFNDGEMEEEKASGMCNHDDEKTNNHLTNGEKEDMISKFENLINFVILHSREKLCTNNLPILLLNDIFDSCTLYNCEKMFSFVEKNVDTWTSEPFFSTGKNYLLRMCNDILRRLSKSQNTVFCGKIQLFLAQLFPVEEKSAVNLNSNFDLGNVTVYKKNPSEFNDDFNSGMDEEDGELTSYPVVDYNLYIKFWSLQDFFRNPPQCYTNIGWKTLRGNINEVLKVFDSHRIEHNIKKKNTFDTKEVLLSELLASKGKTLFAKYLTNEKLLNLQMNDSNFRRYFLVQLLILFQYLTGDLKKFKTATQVLSDNQSAWIKEMTDKVYAVICDTPPNGKQFAASVQHILNREENWINWKNYGCGSFAKYSPVISDELEDTPKEYKKKGQKRSIGDDFLINHKKMNLGNAELTKLWNLCPDNIEACKSENRLKFLPTLETFFEEAIEQADPDAGIEEEYKVTNHADFQWRALRLLARRSHHFFTPTQTPFKALPEYLSSIIDNLSNDLNKPSKVVVKEETSESRVEGNLSDVS